MYVCLCNALTTRDIHQHVEGGCGSVAGLYKRLGCRPQCGKCVTDIRQLVQAAKDALTAEPNMAGAD